MKALRGAANSKSGVERGGAHAQFSSVIMDIVFWRGSILMIKSTITRKPALRIKSNLKMKPSLIMKSSLIVKPASMLKSTLII